MLVLKKGGAVRFVVWCGAACALRVLGAAQRAGLCGARHSFLVAGLGEGLRAAQLQAYSHGGANVTALRLFDPRARGVARYMVAWREAGARRAALPDAELQAAELEPPPAVLLTRDVTVLAARAAARLALPAMPLADCAKGQASFHADTLLNYLRSVSRSHRSRRSYAMRYECLPSHIVSSGSTSPCRVLKLGGRYHS